MMVVLGHIFYYNGYRETLLCAGIYSFHMSLFMFISGFCAMWTYKPLVRSNEILMYVGKKVRTILLPYAVWSFLIGPIRGYYTSGVYDIFPWGGYYWFLPCLFILSVCFLLYNLIRNRITSTSWYVDCLIIFSILVLLAVLFVVYPNTFTKRSLTYMLPYFFGVIVAKYDGLNQYIRSHRYLLVLGVILFLAVVGIYWYATVNNLDLIALVTKLVSGFAMIIVGLNFFQNIRLPIWLNRQLSLIGSNTLGIYLIQMLFITDILFPQGMNHMMAFLLGIIACIAITYLCLGVVKIVGKFKFLPYILFGQV